jgi:mono/diheme cytochrome c family protein
MRPTVSGYPPHSSALQLKTPELAIVKDSELDKQLKLKHLFCLPLFLAGCQNLPSAERAAAPLIPGKALAQASCGSCHAIGRNGASSNPNSPPFSAIANQEGLTAETLSLWLRGAHNYPSEMDFYLPERQVEELVAYMLTLRTPNYRRQPD